MPYGKLFLSCVLKKMPGNVKFVQYLKSKWYQYEDNKRNQIVTKIGSVLWVFRMHQPAKFQTKPPMRSDIHTHTHTHKSLRPLGTDGQTDERMDGRKLSQLVFGRSSG